MIQAVAETPTPTQTLVQASVSQHSQHLVNRQRIAASCPVQAKKVYPAIHHVAPEPTSFGFSLGRVPLVSQNLTHSQCMLGLSKHTTKTIRNIPKTSKNHCDLIPHHPTVSHPLCSTSHLDHRQGRKIWHMLSRHGQP